LGVRISPGSPVPAHTRLPAAPRVVNGPDGTVLADRTGAGTDPRTYGVNGHHDVTWLADTSGAVTATARYDPWGTVVRSSGSLPDWRFQGSWYDTATELAYARARWYSPALGSFVSEDTLLAHPRPPPAAISSPTPRETRWAGGIRAGIKT
jgi:RHS repeat-associated protein